MLQIMVVNMYKHW